MANTMKELNERKKALANIKGNGADANVANAGPKMQQVVCELRIRHFAFALLD